MEDPLASTPFEVPAHIAQHQALRRKAKRMRAILRMQISKPIEEQCTFLVEHGFSIDEIAEASELRREDVEVLSKGICYPYVRNQWIRYFHEPEDHVERVKPRRTKWER